jgi:hypothetical protein
MWTGRHVFHKQPPLAVGLVFVGSMSKSLAMHSGVVYLSEIMDIVFELRFGWVVF